MAFPPPSPGRFPPPGTKRPYPEGPREWGSPTRLPKEPKPLGTESYLSGATGTPRPLQGVKRGASNVYRPQNKSGRPPFNANRGSKNRPPFNRGRSGRGGYGPTRPPLDRARQPVGFRGPLFQQEQPPYDYPGPLPSYGIPRPPHGNFPPRYSGDSDRRPPFDYNYGGPAVYDDGLEECYRSVPYTAGEQLTENRNEGSSLDFTDDYAVFGIPGRAIDSAQIQGHGNNWHSMGQEHSSGQFGELGGQESWLRQGETGLEGYHQGNRGDKRRGQERYTSGADASRGPGRSGLPPSSFSSQKGKSRGKKGSYVPPVHSLSKIRPTVFDLKNMSTAEKLRRLSLFLRSDDSMKENPQQTLNCAITTCKLNIKVDFQKEILMKLSGGHLLTGTLSLDGVFLARAVKPNRKALMAEVYQRAIDNLLTKTMAEIYSLKDPGPENLKEQVMKQLEIDKEANYASVQDLYTSNELSELIGTNIATMVLNLMQTVKNTNVEKPHPVQSMDFAADQAHLLIRPEYTSLTKQVRNQSYTKGKLSIGSLIIARGTSTGKKLAKVETYKNALERLKTKKLEELLISVPDTLEPEIEEEVVPEPKTRSLEEKMAIFIADLRTMKDRTSYVNTVDIVSMRNLITPMILFRRGRQEDERTSDTELICELYLQKILIASVRGSAKKECIQQVYKKAFELLMETKADTILSEYSRITDEELKDPMLVDIIIKGSGRTVETNLAGLGRFGGTLESAEKKKLEDLILLEHETWKERRLFNAHGILQFSCNQNGMLIQWEVDSVHDIYRCIVSIQNQVVGEACGKSKNQSRNAASIDALCKLYQTHDAIRFFPRTEDHELWIPWESIVAEAEAKQKLLQENSKNTGAEEANEAKTKGEAAKTDSETKQVEKEASETDGDLEKKEDSKVKDKNEDENAEQDMELAAVVLKKMEDLVASKQNNELIIGTGITNHVMKEARTYAKFLNLRVDTLKHKDLQYAMITRKMPWKELAEYLKVREKPYGRFALIDKAELPTLEVAQENIANLLLSGGLEMKEALERVGELDLAALLEKKLKDQEHLRKYKHLRKAGMVKSNQTEEEQSENLEKDKLDGSKKKSRAKKNTFKSEMDAQQESKLSEDESKHASVEGQRKNSIEIEKELVDKLRKRSADERQHLADKTDAKRFKSGSKSDNRETKPDKHSKSKSQHHGDDSDNDNDSDVDVVEVEDKEEQDVSKAMDMLLGNDDDNF